MKRGSVVLLRLPPPDPAQPSHVQAGARPAIIVQETESIARLRTLTVVPLTSRLRARRFPYAVEIMPDASNGLTARSVAMVHQVTTVDRLRDVGSIIGHVPDKQLAQVDRALAAYLSFKIAEPPEEPPRPINHDYG